MGGGCVKAASVRLKVILEMPMLVYSQLQLKSGVFADPTGLFCEGHCLCSWVLMSKLIGKMHLETKRQK